MHVFNNIHMRGKYVLSIFAVYNHFDCIVQHMNTRIERILYSFK